MDLDEPVNENGSHFIIYFNLSLHVVRLDQVTLFRSEQVLENVGCILRTVTRISRRLNVAQMDLILVFRYYRNFSLSLAVFLSLIFWLKILGICGHHLRILVLLSFIGARIHVRHN